MFHAALNFRPTGEQFMIEHFWLGMAVIIASGGLNGSFALPMKYARQWRWENTWLVFSLTALLVLPWVLAAGFVPQLGELYREAPSRVILIPLIFGFLWGIAQTTFGLSIKAVGMAFAFAVVSGLGCLLGSLIPILTANPADLFRPRGLLLLASLPILFPGLVLYSMAGRRREKEQATGAGVGDGAVMSFAAGLAITIFTGVFGANLNLGFHFGHDLVRRGLELGANPATSTYPVWALVLPAGLIPNLLYCVYLLFRNGTWSAFRTSAWAKEGALAIAMALLWLGGIVCYGIGATLAGRYGTSVGFALFSASIILAANVGGILAGEWRSTSAKTRKMLALGMTAILIAIVVLNLGGLF
jgi:L-rhamnose-H+ transport protein